MFADLLRKGLEGVAGVSDAQAAVLRAHYELLLKWNQVLNLTRVERVEEAVERHYCESVFLAARMAAGAARVADIGSGAGFPGLVVAVMRPELQVTLIESHQRKAVFLREAARGLGNVRVLAERGEAVKEEFDICVSRAVSYDDLAKCLKRLAPVADLLTGEEAPPAKLKFGWDEAVQLPWGERRYWRHGERIRA